MFPARISALAAAGVLAFAASAASAQIYPPAYATGGSSYGYGYGSNYSYGAADYSGCRDACGRNYQRRDYSYQGQRDRPGDYRCDAYWDRGRDDCDARWRDQRGYGYRWSDWRSHGNRYGGYDRGYGWGGHGGGGYGGGYGGGQVYYGQYGAPDVVHSGGYGGYDDGRGHGHDHGAYGRDPRRVAQCCAEFRSYDPRSGYYTTYDGRRAFCG